MRNLGLDKLEIVKDTAIQVGIESPHTEIRMK